MLYKNVKFYPHPLEIVKPSLPHPKKNPLEMKNPQAAHHLISPEHNFERTPSTPPKKQFSGKKIKNKK
jgi:hypothetical protein